MKPLYVVFLMGAAALGGGLVVRYSEHPVEITLNRPVPPPVVAPPIPPTAHVGPSSSVPIRPAPPETPAAEPVTPDKPEKPVAGKPVAGKPEKPSAFSALVHLSKPEPPSEPRPIGRVRIPPEPPAVIPLERTSPPPATPQQKVAANTPPASTHSPEPAGILRDPDPSTLSAAAKPSPEPARPARQSAAPPNAPNHATLKAGMLITIRIADALSSNTNSAGDVFSGTLDKPLIADGFVIAERGARVRGEVVGSKSAGRGSELTIRLREIQASDGQRVHIVSDPWRKVSTGNDARPRSVYDVPLTRESAAVIRPATTITFRLDEPVELTEKR